MDIIHICKNARQYSQEYVASAIRECRNIDIQNNIGVTPLSAAAMHSKETSTFETVKMLIQAGANLNLADKWGMSPLILAAMYSSTNSSLETVELLIKAGANLDIQDDCGNTALMFAVLYANSTSSIETVEMLIKAGANLDIQKQHGETALMLTDNPDVIKMLIQAGANLDIQNEKGWSYRIASLMNVKLLSIHVQQDISKLSNFYTDKFAEIEARSLANIEKIQYQVQPGTEFWTLIKQEYPTISEYEMFKSTR